MEAVRIVMSGMWLQDSGSLSSGNSRLLMIFVGMVAIAMVVQAIAVIVLAVGAAKASKKGLEIAEELRTKMGPILDTTHGMIQDSAPKVKIITENLVETSHVVRSKAAGVRCNGERIEYEDASAGGAGGWDGDLGAEYYVRYFGHASAGGEGSGA